MNKGEKTREGLTPSLLTVMNRKTTHLRKCNTKDITGYCPSCRKLNYLKYKSKQLDRAKVYVRERRITDWASVNYPQIRLRSEKKGHIIDFTKDQFKEWFDKQSHCFYCNLSVSTLQKLGISTSIDRIDNSISYVRGNIVLSCLPCNKVKGETLTEEDMWTVGPVVGRRIVEKLWQM